MSFVQRELERIQSALADHDHPDWQRLHDAQQALMWALEPTGYASPYEAIKGKSEGSASCSAHSCPLPS